MEKKKNTILLYVVLVLLVVVAGISLAYFTTTSATSGKGGETDVQTLTVEDTTVVTEGNIKFTDLDIYPGHKNVSKLKVTATGNKTVGYNLTWTGINTLQTTLNYTVYKSTTNENPTITCEKVKTTDKQLYETCTNTGFDNLEQIATGGITTATANTTFNLKENETITATSEGTVIYYYVVLEFPNTDTPQNFDTDGKFEGTTDIKIPGVLKPVTDVTSLIATLEVKAKKTAPDFSQVATGGEDEENNGIFATSDGMYGGTTYYWRGAATSNYVTFAGFCWRIVRINGDGTMRLIYDGATCHANETETAESIAVAETAYNPNWDNSSYVGWSYTLGSQRPNDTSPQTSGTRAPIRVTLEDTWYKTNIIDKGFDGKVTTGKYCNDRNTGQPASSWVWSSGSYTTTWGATGTQFAYAAAGRLGNGTWVPTISCPKGDEYEAKVGLITADEVQFAGASWTTSNTKYYLYNGQYYWTMSPISWCGGNAWVFIVDANGSLGGNYVHGANGIRPVINLNADTQFSSGDGTLDTPYVVI